MLYSTESSTLGDWLPGLLFATIMALLVTSLVLETGKRVFRRLQKHKTASKVIPLRRRPPYYSKDKL